MFREEALKYLGYQGQTMTKEMESLFEDSILEVQKESHFKATTKEFKLEHHPLRIPALDITLSYEDITTYFKGCHHCLIIACTLGISLERRIKYWSKVNLTKSVMMDAIASAYLEECCDQYEETLNLGARTFRFAPGYGDLPLELNIPLGQVLQIEKTIGVTRTQGGLFLPQKSMLGLIGLGNDHKKKTCGNCIRKESCSLRKEGLRCYKTN